MEYGAKMGYGCVFRKKRLIDRFTPSVHKMARLTSKILQYLLQRFLT